MDESSYRCELKISKACTGLSQVYSGLSNKNCCGVCCELYKQRYWSKNFSKEDLLVPEPKAIDNASSSRQMNLPRFIDPGMADVTPAILRWRFEGLPWAKDSGLVVKSAGIYRRLYADAKQKGKLKFQTYELVPATPEQIRVWKGGVEEVFELSSKKSKIEKENDMKNELDELKTTPKATPKVGVAKKAAPAKVGVTKKVASAKAVTSKQGFQIRPGTNNEKVFNALKSGSVVTFGQLAKGVPAKMVVLVVKYLISKGMKIKVIGNNEKFLLLK